MTFHARAMRAAGILSPAQIRRKENQGIIHHLDFPAELKKVTEEGTFEGYASVWGVRDSFNEVVEPGAFTESLVAHRRSGTYPIMLWMHNTDEPIGVWKDLAEDKKGLYGLGKLTKGVRQADEAHLLLKDGALRGLSIGYRELEAENPSGDGGPRRLLKLDLMEISVVSFPANRRALITDVKADDIGERLAALARQLRGGETLPPKLLEEILRDAGFSKSQATALVSKGWGALRGDPDNGGHRSDSEGESEQVRQRLAEMASQLGALKL